MESQGFSRLFHNFENVLEPKECLAIGTVPSYLKGTMVRNSPEMFEIGEDKYKHWFDGLGFMQRYHFEDGKMFYSARYLESEAFKKNMEAQRIVTGSFGTVSFPDPCKTIFSKMFSTFLTTPEKHDNANVAFTPVGDAVYACTETPHMFKIDMDTLATLEPAVLTNYVALHTCTAHQLYDERGDVYNIGSRFGPDGGYVFTVTRNPKNLPSESSASWEHTEKIGEIRCTDPLFPTYMHSFGMSENYLVMFESPVRINMQQLLLRHVIRSTYQACLNWDGEKDVNVFIMNKRTGQKLDLELRVAPFFTFHHANSFEKDGCLVVDYCSIENAGNFDALMIDKLRTGYFQHDPNFLPFLTRLVIPLEVPEAALPGEDLLKSKHWASGCTAILQENGAIRLTERRTCDISLEFPRFHWEQINMKEYQFVYGSTVLGVQNHSTVGVVKADLLSGRHLVWKRADENQLCGEPIFVPDPNGKAEDDGILIVPVMTITASQKPFVVILSAKTMKEQARFEIPEERIPLGFHAFYQNR